MRNLSPVIALDGLQTAVAVIFGVYTALLVWHSMSLVRRYPELPAFRWAGIVGAGLGGLGFALAFSATVWALWLAVACLITAFALQLAVMFWRHRHVKQSRLRSQSQ